MDESERRLSATYSSQQLITEPSDSRTLAEANLRRHHSIQPTNDRTPRSHIITVGVLCFINLINYMDRFTIAGVLSELQEDFKIDDSKAGLLQTAFIISYMVFAPIFGYLGDRYSRKWIMGCGVALWSLTTLVGSFMPSYGIFLVLRALVGIGEASYSTIAPTIVSDLFVKDQRSKFLAVFYFAIPVGSGLGYIVGSETANALNSWRWALRVTPVLGVIAVMLLFFCVEPERGQSEGTHNLQPTSYTDDLKALCNNRSFMLSTAGFTCVAFVAGALAWWGPTYMYLGMKTRDPNVKFNEVSFTFGFITMVSGIIGVPLGSYLSQTYIKKFPKCDPLICAFGLIISAPLMSGAMLAVPANTVLTYVLIFFAELSLNLNWAIVADILLYVVIPTRRSTAEAFQILISHALGDAGSPYMIGVISDTIKNYMGISNNFPEGSYFVKSDNFSISSMPMNFTQPFPVNMSMEEDVIKFKALQYALFTTSFVEVLGAVFFLATAAYILRDKKNAEAAISDEIISTTPSSSQSITPSNPTIYNYD